MRNKKSKPTNDLLYRVSTNKITAIIKRTLKAIKYKVSNSISLICL